MKKTFLLLFFVVFLAGCGVTTTDAEHTGYVTAVEKNGLIWKTGRAYIKTELSSSQEDFYCVDDEDLYDKLKEKAASKENITVIYKSEVITSFTRCGSEADIITGIK